MSKKSERKLAVILFADVVGYTSLMQLNESNALNTIKNFRSIIEETIPNYGGKIIQYYGDGCLISFTSSTEGVNCAINLQFKFVKSENLPVRIGMHMGEVVFEEENVYGDGVNIASRIESIGVPGSVLISKSIRDQIKNKEEFKIDLLGSFGFKNVKENITVYSLINEGLTVPDKKNITGKLKSSNNSIFKRKDVQVSGIIINLLIVILLGVWYWSDFKKDEKLIVKNGNKYVLAIGVDNNPNWLRLYNAKNDANGVVDVLQEYFGFQQLADPLINEAATKEEILNRLEKAGQILKSDDQLLVFYAGHGYSSPVSNGDPEGYIVPYDGPSEESQDPSGFIKISDFLKKVSDLPARHITTIFDACYSGFALQDQLIVSRGSPRSLKEASVNTSRKIFSSADHDQIAADNGPIAEHSLFSGFLIEGLRTGRADSNADEVITMNELAIYLQSNVFDYSSTGQIPRYGNFLSDEGGEMLLRYNNDELRKKLTVKDIIKGKDEIYTALPFRTSSIKDEYLAYKTYLPEIIIEALGEYDKGDYKIVNLNLLTETDSTSTNTPLSDYIKRAGVTKYFTGTFNLFEKIAVVKISLNDAKDASNIYTFPDIVKKINNQKDKSDLGQDIKYIIKGFIDNNTQVLQRMTYPPNYEAYKELKRAYDHLNNNDRKTALKYINKAIEIDPKYFRAHLAKVFSYINCTPVNVHLAIEEYSKLKNINFNISDHEEDRLNLLYLEAIGDYPSLVQSKLKLLMDYPNRTTFTSAMWYAIADKDITTANKMIQIVEENEVDGDFNNLIFAYKNIIEQHLSPFSKPVHYERLMKEEELLGKYFRFLFQSKLLFDCNENCYANFIELMDKYGQTHWSYFQKAGQLLEYKGQEKASQAFYRKAWDDYKNVDDQSFSNTITLQFQLKNYQECISLVEEELDSLLIKEDLSPIRYYIIAQMKLGQQTHNKDSLMEALKSYQRFPGFGYYYLASIYAIEGNIKEANKYLKMAQRNGVAFDPYRYNFDPDLKPMWDDPEFIAFTTPK